MRLNRGTIALVVVGIIVIAGVLLINNNQANTPDATPTATEQTGGPLFPDLTADTLAQVVVRDNSNGARTVLVRTSDGLWELDEPRASSSEAEALEALIAALETTDEPTETAEATAEATALPVSTPDPELDQNTVLTTIDGLVGLTASDRFDSDQLEGFGLNQPSYSILITTTDGIVQVLHIGGENPSGNRYYAVQEQLSIADMTPEPSLRAEATDIVATDEPTDEAVQDATATEPVEAVEAVETDEATEEADSVSTEEAESDATEEATEEATAEATPEATPEVGATLPPLPTPTPEPLAEPLVTLSGTRTINTIPKTTIDQLIGYIALPPYFVPTPTPTLPFAIPEITLETTPEAEATVEATEEATEEPTVEPTTQPTDEPTVTPTRRATATPAPTSRPTEEETPEATAESTSES